MSFSEEVLANIKTIDENEFETGDYKALEEVFSGLPAVPKVTVADDDEEEEEATVDSSYADQEDAVAIIAEDPLLEKANIANKRRHFAGEFNEDDLLIDAAAVITKHEPPEDGKKKYGRGGKRARLSNELKGNSGHIWSVEAPAQMLEAAATVAPSSKGPARQVCNPLEAWTLLLDEPILSEIVRLTNEEIKRRTAQQPKEALKRTTDLIELRAWLGLSYLCGLFRNAEQNGPLQELWTLELGNAIFRATMPLKRFEFLADAMRFCYCYGQAARRSPLEPVRQLWERFIINCRSYYAPSGNCALGEYILGTSDETCPHQFTLAEQPLQSGLRLVTLCDAKTLYMCNALLGADDKPHESDVLQLVSDLKGTKRNIALSARYTSLTLAAKLRQSQLTLVGTLPRTARELPPELLDTQQAPQQFYGAAGAVLHTGLEAAGACPTGVLLSCGLASSINAPKLFATTGGACARFQTLAAAYSTSCATPTRPAGYRWSLRCFHAVLDYAALNAWTLLRLSQHAAAPVAITQRDFLRQLGLYLTQQQLKRRLMRTSERLSLMQRLQICEILGESTDRLLSEATKLAAVACGEGTIAAGRVQAGEDVTLLSKHNEKRLRCRKCKSDGNKTRMRCQQCLKPLCYRHLILRCSDCSGVEYEEAKNDNDPFK